MTDINDNVRGLQVMDELNKKPKKRDDLAIHELGDEVMLYDAANEKIHVLNHTASLIWNFCDGQHSIKDIKEEMNKKYPIIEDKHLFQDIMKTIEELSNKILLK